MLRCHLFHSQEGTTQATRLLTCRAGRQSLLCLLLQHSQYCECWQEVKAAEGGGSASAAGSSGRKALPMLGACCPANTKSHFLAAILQCPLSCCPLFCVSSSRDAPPCPTVCFLQGRLRAVNPAELLVSPRGDGNFLDVLPAALTKKGEISLSVPLAQQLHPNKV